MVGWLIGWTLTSVADLGCLAQILIFTHPGCHILDSGSLISDPGSKINSKREGLKKLVVIPFFCSHKFHKI
jgi:hypothetical protein